MKKLLFIFATLLLFISCDPFDPTGKSQYEIDLHYAETHSHTTERSWLRERVGETGCVHGRVHSNTLYGSTPVFEDGIYWRVVEVDVYNGDLIYYNKPIRDQGTHFSIWRCEDCGYYYKIYYGADNSHLWWMQ